MPVISVGGEGGRLITPLDRLRGERADQHLPKIAPVDLGTIAGEAAGVIEQNDAGFINDTFRVFPAPDKAEELVK